MSNASRRVAGVLLVVVPTIEFGGATLLSFIVRREHGYLDNPVRQALFRAMHAHAGVLLLLTLVALLYVDRTALSEGARWLVRLTIAAAPILIPAGFAFSVLSPDAQAPGAALTLTYLGALSLAVGTVTLGVGLLRRPAA